VSDTADPSSGQQTLTLQQALDLAVKHHTAGDLAQAESIYNQILEADPNQPQALHLLGVIAHQRGQNEKAVELIEKALTINPDFAEAYSNLGNAFKELAQRDRAMSSYYSALKINPDLVNAHYNLGTVFQELGQLEEAVSSYGKALALKPDYAEAHNNLGNTFKELGKLDEAIVSYESALKFKPDLAEAYYNLGLVLGKTGQFDEAIDNNQKALALKPNFVEANYNLAIWLNAAGHHLKALEHFGKVLELERGDNPVNPDDKTFQFISRSKIRHDIEQYQYLASQEHDRERFLEFANLYKAVEGEIAWPNEDTTVIPLSAEHKKRIGGTYNRAINLVEAPEVSGSALSSTLDVEKITADYYSHAAGMTYFDGLLSSEALTSLRHFLLSSTIWCDFKYSGGYIGTFLRDGLACPLLLQISDELRRTFPDVFKNHQLMQLWAYKYDSRLTGIEVHADFAAVNVNFWITPDTANMNSASGGLVVYDAEAPLDWDFKIYNKNQRRIRQFLDEHNSGKTVVPYRENRIVLFNSNLFHETDTIEFKSGYENRRINITMLFGDRVLR